MNKLGRDSLGNANIKYQSPMPPSFRVEESLNFAFFVPMFHLVTPGVGLILTQGASYEETGRGPLGNGT